MVCRSGVSAILRPFLGFRLRLGRLRPWPGHRGVGLNARDQRDRFVSAERDVNFARWFSHTTTLPVL
jgi:hypothetical protein